MFVFKWFVCSAIIFIFKPDLAIAILGGFGLALLDTFLEGPKD